MMHLHLLGSVLVGYLGAASAVPVVVESLDRVPENWNHVRSADAGQYLKLSIGLAQPNLKVFERTLYEVSDPAHTRYGKHLTREELKELTKPQELSTNLVLRWLESSNVPSHSIENDEEWIHFRAPVETVEGFLSTKFSLYSMIGGHGHAVRTLEYSVPEEIRAHITTIQPTTYFSALRNKRSNTRLDGDRHLKRAVPPSPSGAPAGVNFTECEETMTPTCLRELYNIKGYRKNAAPGNVIGVAGFLEQSAQYYELSRFLDQFLPESSGANFSVTLINGGQNQQGEYPSYEANLDTQYALGLSHPIPTRFYSTAGRGPEINDLDAPAGEDNFIEPWLEFVSYMVALPDNKLPRVLSISYGENEQIIPKAYAKAVCTMFGILGARGVSVLTSSGDQGPGMSCQSNDGQNRTKFLPAWPGACPWVTSVGGTWKTHPEEAIFFSSGGFSDYFPRPAYQDKAVTQFLKKNKGQFAQYFDAGGRGFPDVAAQGWHYQFWNHNQVIDGDGTSASAPTFAAIIALINNERLLEGKPSMGFLNPWLYSEGYKGLTDIKHGGSIGCEGRSRYDLPSPIIPYASWNATEGWDPVTGLGTPLFGKLLRLACKRLQLSKSLGLRLEDSHAP